MANIEFTKTQVIEEDSYTYEMYEIIADSVKVGAFSLMIDDESTYLERIDIEEEHQNKGYGTAAILKIARTFNEVFTAPDNENAQRLYKKIGVESSKHEEVDQGFGVYEF